MYRTYIGSIGAVTSSPEGKLIALNVLWEWRCRRRGLLPGFGASPENSSFYALYKVQTGKSKTFVYAHYIKHN
jgi:hypothetical protein